MQFIRMAGALTLKEQAAQGFTTRLLACLVNERQIKLDVRHRCS